MRIILGKIIMRHACRQPVRITRRNIKAVQKCRLPVHRRIDGQCQRLQEGLHAMPPCLPVAGIIHRLDRFLGSSLGGEARPFVVLPLQVQAGFRKIVLRLTEPIAASL